MLTVAVPKRNKLPNIIVLTPKDGPVAASCHPLLFINYMMREVVAVWKLWICG